MPRTRHLALLGLAALAPLGCGGSQAPAPAPLADPANSREPATLAGKVELSAELTGERRGSVTIQAWGEGEAGRAGAEPYLSRIYAMDDPDWLPGDSTLAHYFGLCEADRVGDPARGLPGELEIEANFDPDGLPGTREGVERGRARARNGATDIEITISPRSETAKPAVPRKQGG
ncbi:MAG: hypothetical protein IPJ19_03945 [Planctomycetes bacterium]|nr:hypothetical protein [Planctomycetota bacterium]